MEKIAIKGHLTRDEDVIKILESLGGINKLNLEGYKCTGYYYIENNCRINCTFLSCLLEYTCYTLEEYEHKFLNSMEIKRNIQIDLTTAKEWYKQGGDLRKIALQAFSEKELKALPSSWEEYCEINPYLEKSKEIFPLVNGNINTFSHDTYLRKEFPGVIPSKERAEQFLILNKLLQIRDYYNQGWKPNWKDDTDKYVIWSFENELHPDVSTYANSLFAFKSKEVRDTFFENFENDLEKVKEFL
jgi:hypothetical protein